MSAELVELELLRELRALQSDLAAVTGQLEVTRAERDRAVALVKGLLLLASFGAEVSAELGGERTAMFRRQVAEATAFLTELRG